MLVLALGAAGCGDESSSSDTSGEDAPATEPADDGTVKVELGEDGARFFLTVDKDTVPAGRTTFEIDNVGTVHHEFVIYRTDIEPGDLPIGDDAKAKLDEASVVGEAVYASPPRGDADHRIRDGRGVDYTIDLEPGTYVLLCNLPGHYQAGQYTSFTVEEPADDAADEPADEIEEPTRDEAVVEGSPVKVELGDKGNAYTIKLDTPTVKAGPTTFVIDNVGTKHHELVVYRTDLAPDKLPIDEEEDKAVLDEESVLGEAVYTTPLRGDPDHRIREGRGVNFTLDLEPGTYVLLCNLAGHYAKGQYVAFTVT